MPEPDQLMSLIVEVLTQPPGNSTPTRTPTLTPAPPPSIGINPNREAAGDRVTVRGVNFLGNTSMSGLEIGSVSVLPSPAPAPNADGSFSTLFLVPRLNPGSYVVDVTIGPWHFSHAFTVTPSVGIVPVATALAPLGSNLQYVLHFDNVSQSWSVYDPSGAFSPDLLGQITPPWLPITLSAEPLTQLVPKLYYELFLTQDQTVTLEGVVYRLFGGGSTMIWQGPGAGSLPTPTATPVPTIAPPQEIEVPVLLEGAVNVASLEFFLSYDPTVLELTGVKAGALASTALLEFNGLTSGSIWAGIIDTSGISGDGPVAVITFKIVGDSESNTALTFADVVAFDATSSLKIITAASAGSFAVKDRSLTAPTLGFLS